MRSIDYHMTCMVRGRLRGKYHIDVVFRVLKETLKNQFRAIYWHMLVRWLGFSLDKMNSPLNFWENCVILWCISKNVFDDAMFMFCKYPLTHPLCLWDEWNAARSSGTISQSDSKVHVITSSRSLRCAMAENINKTSLVCTQTLLLQTFEFSARTNQLESKFGLIEADIYVWIHRSDRRMEFFSYWPSAVVMRNYMDNNVVRSLKGIRSNKEGWGRSCFVGYYR